MGNRRTWRVAAVVAATMVAALFAYSPAEAAVPQSTVVSAVPSKLTPNVNDGDTFTIATQGGHIFLGGDFTNATSYNATTATTRADILSFDPSTGVIDAGFAPTLNGEVDQIIPGAGNTIYVTGLFTTVNGKAMRVARLDATTGAVISTWKPPSMSAAPETLALDGDTLYIGGGFIKVGGVAHGGLAALNSTTGALLPWLQINVANHHGTGGSVGPVGPKKFALTADGSKLIVIGNFTTVTDNTGTYSRDQVFLLNLVKGTSATVDQGWATQAYTAQCFNWAFDSYIRDVDISPDGSYFVIVATGGSGTNTDGTRSLCDTAARWDFATRGANVTPTWVDYTGQDSLWSVQVTGTAIYVGGHQRWLNNSNGYDASGAGAVPRPGLAALDPVSGVPLSWNPGRNPRGAGAWSLLATPTGLYVGSDTEWIGNYQYHRSRIAYFPLAGGTTVPAGATGTLPGTVYQAGTFGNAHPEVLYRVDTGGPTVGATDGGPDWSDDSQSTSPYRNAQSNSAGYSPSATEDSTIPAGTPTALFDSERWSPTDNPPMTWNFPVPSGDQVQVRLYFANRYSGTASAGQRVFNVDVEGQTLNNFDIVAATGGTNIATMRAFNVTSDGSVDISLTHVTENPLINAIEIIQTSPTPPAPSASALVGRTLATDNTVGAPTTVDSTTLTWANVRGAFLVDHTLFYGQTDGTFHERSFDGTTLGADSTVDPYHDPTWAGVPTGSGSSVYTGVVPDYYGELSRVTSAFYSGGRLYYTLSGSSSMYYRWFSPESGIVGSAEYTTTDGTNWNGIAGAFVSGGNLYYATVADGVLHEISWVGGQASGSATTVDSTVNWAAHSLFLMTGNLPPVATFSSSCPSGQLSCTFDSTGTKDPDGTISSYAWSFGDGSSGTGASPSHAYSGTGPYTVALTVTDNGGAQTTYQSVVNVVNAAPVAHLTVSCPTGTLQCTLDAHTSSDDGGIATYQWDFGDGHSQSTTASSVTHAYASAGSFNVSVTVTDSLGATGSDTGTAAPTAGSHPAIAFRASASTTTTSGTTAQVKVPATVHAGDALVLVETVNGTQTTATPAGWALEASKANGTAMTSNVYSKVATAGDVGSSVTFTFSATAKAALALTAYSGASVSDPVGALSSAIDSGSATHTTPAVSVPTAGSWVVSYWSDKSATTPTSWTTPASATAREKAIPVSSAGAIAAELADSGAAVVTGSYPGSAATVNTTSTKGITWAITVNAGS